MASVVEICNSALLKIRSNSINSLDESSVAAQACKLEYPTVRDQVLKDFDWGLNNTTKALQALTVTVHGWAYTWRYPNDCLRINKLMRDTEAISADSGGYVVSDQFDHRFRAIGSPKIKYRVVNANGEKVIVTNEPNLYINYRSRVEDTSLYNSDIVTAISYLLAANLSIVLAGVKDGRALRTDNLALYTAFKNQAQEDSADERDSTPEESEFITIRS